MQKYQKLMKEDPWKTLKTHKDIVISALDLKRAETKIDLSKIKPSIISGLIFAVIIFIASYFLSVSQPYFFILPILITIYKFARTYKNKVPETFSCLRASVLMSGPIS